MDDNATKLKMENEHHDGFMVMDSESGLFALLDMDYGNTNASSELWKLGNQLFKLVTRQPPS